MVTEVVQVTGGNEGAGVTTEKQEENGSALHLMEKPTCYLHSESHQQGRTQGTDIAKRATGRRTIAHTGMGASP